MDYHPNIATQPPPPVHYGWAVPGVASPDPRIITGHPPPYTLNPPNRMQLPPHLAAGQTTIFICGQPPPYSSNFPTSPQSPTSAPPPPPPPPPPGWTFGPGRANMAYGKPRMQPDDAGSASVHVEAPDSAHSDRNAEASFSDKQIRLAFIRKVYAILMVQLAITTGFIALFLFEPNTAGFARRHPEMMSISMVCTLVLTVVLLCYDELRRTWPMNFILLLAFTVCEGWVLGMFCSHFEVTEVVMAAGICTVVCLALTAFAFQTKWDLTAHSGCLFVALIVLSLFGFIAMFYPGGAMRLVYSALGALLFSFYLVYDTQMMMGGQHKLAISPEEYIFAALSIYLDIIQLFMRILVMTDN